DVSEAMPFLLAGIGQAIGWDAAGFWYWDPSSNTLCALDFWTSPKVSIGKFRNAIGEFSFESGGGLPGRVWADRSPVWIEDLATASAFRRLGSVSRLGLGSAFAFPVCVGPDCVGVMEFFSAEYAREDAGLLEAMDALGSDIGQFIRRR